MNVKEIKEGQFVYLAPNKVQVHKVRVKHKIDMVEGGVRLKFNNDRELFIDKPECKYIFDNEIEANEYFEKNVQVK